MLTVGLDEKDTIDVLLAVGLRSRDLVYDRDWLCAPVDNRRGVKGKFDCAPVTFRMMLTIIC